jgi:hypothetical protein
MTRSARARGLLEGAIDLHVHVHPAVRKRLADSRELATQAAAAGMRGLLLKDHDRSTVADAWHANSAAGGVEVFGAVCLNAPNGGVNPAAAEAALRMGAAAVFLPTDSARNDAEFWRRHLGDPAERAAVVGESPRRFTAELDAVDGAGELTADVRAVIELCAEAGALVCTGHLGSDEVTAVVDACAAIGARVVVTHAPVFTEAGPDLLARWAQAGAILELVAVFCCATQHLPTSVQRSFAVEAALIDQVGASGFTLSSDLGQVGNPPPADGLAQFIDGLLGEGISEGDLILMTHDNPARAIGLPA